MRLNRIACVGVLAILLLAVTPRQVESQVPAITATTDLVIVPTLVQEPSGALVHTLHASDFVVTDNGVPQTVHLEDVERQPLSIVVLLQTGASASREFPYYKKLGTMLTYVTENIPHQIAMVSFDSRPEDEWDFTPDIADLQDGFDHPDPGDGKAAILDAVKYGIDLLRSQPQSRRRILMLISQTHDDGSVTHAEDIVKRLGESNITIESFTFSPEKAWLKDQLAGDREMNKPYQYGANGPSLLYTFNLDKPLRMAIGSLRKNTSSSIALMSGGESFPFATKAELEEKLSLLPNHLAATFTLSFQPSPKRAGFHSLEVHVAGHPELEVFARTSYWAADAVAP